MKKAVIHYICLTLICGCAVVAFMNLGRNVTACSLAGVLGLVATYVLIRMEKDDDGRKTL